MAGPQLRIREQAITAAEALIDKYNFSLENLSLALDTSLKEVQAGIESVDQLMVEVNSRTMDRLLATVSREASQTGSPASRVESLCQVFLSFAEKHKPFIETLFLHPFPDGFQRPYWYLDQVAACFKPLETALQALKPSASPEECVLAARGLWSQVLGVFFLCYHQRLTPVGIKNQEQLITFNIQTFLKGWGS